MNDHFVFVQNDFENIKTVEYFFIQVDFDFADGNLRVSYRYFS